MTNITLPSVLAFDRNLEPSDALMWSGNWQDISVSNKDAWQAIELFERRNRAVKSNFKKEVLENEEELQKQVAEANLSWGDDAALSYQHDTLKLSFSLRIVAGIDQPSVCNDIEFAQAFSEKVGHYLQEGLDELANRYAYNIANGRFLWRNRIDAQAIKVVVTKPSLATALEFNSDDFSLQKTTAENHNISQLAQLIKLGLLGENKTLLTINAFVQLGQGQRVWPSQEMVLNSPKGEKSRHLFAIMDSGKRLAAMHSEKIGNALRTIDDWYPDFENVMQPIAIEAYGSVTQKGKAYRSNKTDFKTLLLKWLNDKETTQDQQHFVVAMLIRGGVFGEVDS